MNCRSCGGETVKFLDLGHHPPSDAFLSNLDEPETHYPLNVHYCTRCSLVQLGYTVPPEILFTKEYPYLTGANKAGVEHFRSLAREVTERFKLTEDDLVIDVGSNDGTLLKGFNCRVLGIEPSGMAADVPTITGWFSEENVVGLNPKVITACNVFAHVPDINGFVETVKNVLAEDGVFIIESPYLLDMVNNLEYDTIYHEHLYYWSYIPLEILVGRHGLEVFDMERQDVHGGTMRYYIGRPGRHDRVRFHVKQIFDAENEFGIDNLIDFSEKVQKHKIELQGLLRRIKQKGKQVVGVSAPAKGNTLLNYCKIDDLRYITEINPLKIGKYAPGTHIPVVSEACLISDKPEYALLLAWNWKDQIIGNLSDYVKGGGRFIIPIPEPHIESIGSGVWAWESL